MAPPDPYATLEISPDASDADVRAAYRRLVQLHHPDHNRGSRESALKFEAVQSAYAQVRTLRAAGGAQRAARGAGRATASARPPRTASTDPRFDSKLADMERELREARAARERELREAQAARERARRAAREAAQAGAPERPSDEELGYVSTDDSFSKIFADAASELADQLGGAREHLSDAREHGVPKRVSDLIDELGSKLTGDPPPKRRDH